MLKFCLFVAMLYALGGAVWFLVFGRRLLRPVIRLPKRRTRSQRYAKKRRMAAYQKRKTAGKPRRFCVK